MKPYYFSNASMERLESCHQDLQTIMRMALGCSAIDFGISCGYRSVEEQQRLYAQGRTAPGLIVTHVDGVNKKSKHNHFPSMAVDVFPWVDGQVSYKKEELSYIAGIVDACAKLLHDTGVISHQIRWGGNWDRDGIILADQSFDDGPHFELI